MRAIVWLWAVALVWPTIGLAAEPRLIDGGRAFVHEVADGRTLVLSDGRVALLAGIGAPGLSPAPAMRGRGQASSSLPGIAKEALGKLVLGRTVRLWFSGTQVDRYGRLLVQVYDDQDQWVQGALLAQGLARVESAADNRGMVRAMQEIEDVARAARLGIWSDPAYGVRTVDETRFFLNRYELVEGRVLAADEVGGRVYLNFGADWRTDFTVSVSPADVRTFRREGIDLLALAGQRVRVRGWIRLYDGPRMDVTHPEQIQLLGP